MKKSNLVRTIILAGSLLLQLSTLCFHSRGAAGDVDLSFDPGSGVNGTVNTVVVQPDGKVVIAGQFTTVKGLARPGLARLNADGSGDSTFNPGAIPDGIISLGLQPDGKVLVGNYSGVLRLNANGSLDTLFSASITAFGYYDGVYAIVVQPDGKVVIGGIFIIVNGTNRNGIARLNANGSLDSSFNPDTGPNSVYSIVLQPDGKVLIGGDWIARLNANGSLDGSFAPLASGNGYVASIALQPDGKVLIGGDFYNYSTNGTIPFVLARLNSNGSLDSSFSPPVLTSGTGDYPAVSSLALQADGKVLIGGAFYAVNFTNRTFIARLNANGSLDGSFNPGGGDSYVLSVAVHPDGRVFIGGSFNVNVTKSSNIVRLNTDGTRDGSFQPGAPLAVPFNTLVVQPDGKVLIGFRHNTFMNGTNRYGSARLNADGSLDSTFISSTNFNPYPAALNPNADCPPGYTCDHGTGITATMVQPDGKVLLGGHFVTRVWGHQEGEDTYDLTRSFLARFNADGGLDAGFAPLVGDSTNTELRALTMQPDGKVVVIGNFLNGTNWSAIIRVNANGALDNSFNAGTGVYGLSAVVSQPDGKVLIAGNFSSVNGTNRNGIARLNANGSLDSTFNPAVGGYPLALQPDGKILLGGHARLNANGSLDTSFHIPSIDGSVMTVALQSDGNILIGGDFTTVNGVVRPRVARLYGDSRPSLNIARSNASVILSWPVSALNFQLQENTNLAFANSWSSVAQPAVTNGTQISVTVPASAPRKFFRLKSQ